MLQTGLSSEGSYNFDLLARPDVESAHLEVRAQMRLSGFPDLLRRHGFPDSGRVLEVGCGQGIRTKIMAELSPHAEVIGIDRSQAMLELTRSALSATQANLSFERADIYELPFLGGSFDFVYARLVFMHLSKPLAALQSISRILKPGGRVLIEDADRDCMFFEPEPENFAAYWKFIQDGQRRLGGDPNVGRRLASYLKEMGFEDLNIEVQPIVGDGADIEFIVRELLPSLRTYLQPQHHDYCDGVVRELHRLSRDPHATFFHFWFAVSGGKPLVEQL
jgi:ubiquinone/menaquinone biosynthesis C-methylase UbiE